MGVKTNSKLSERPTKPGPKAAAALTPGERASKVLKAAGEVFLSRGYAGASLENIVAKSGGSLRDLYQMFGNKESLFRRVMSESCEEVLAPLRDLAMAEGSQDLPIEEVLIELGKRILRVLLSKRALSIHRLVVSESPRFPDLGTFFFQMGPSTANATIAALLENRAQKEQLIIPNANAASAIFIHSVISELHLRALTGGKVTEAEAEERVKEAVRIFLDGVRRPM